MMRSIDLSQRGLAAQALVLMLAGASAPVPAAASIIDTTRSIVAGGKVTLGKSTGFDVTVLDATRSAQAGSISGNGFTGYYGARLRGTVGAKLNANGSVGVSNDVTSLFSGSSSMFAGGASQVGGAFILRNDINIAKTTVYTAKGVVSADLNQTIYAGASVTGKVCVIGCIPETTIVGLGFGSPNELKVVGYNSATNNVTFLGQTYANSLPKTFNAPGGLPISATVNPVSLAAKGVGSSSAGVQSGQDIGGVYVDVAAAMANAFGIPSALLSGSVAGFNYNVISAKVGFGINIAYQAVTSIIDTATRYTFSGFVSRQDSTGKFRVPDKTLTLRNGETAILRAAGQANLGITAETLVTTKTVMTASIGIAANANIRMLELHGNGLNFGPLYANEFSIPLGTLATLRSEGIFTSKGTNGTFNLGFGVGAAPSGAAQLSALSDGLAALGDGPVLFGDSSGFVFMPTGTSGDTISGFVTSGFIRRVTNYGISGCDEDTIDNCIYDDSFEGIPQSKRVTYTATGEELVDYSSDFTDVSAIDPLDIGAFGEQSTPASLMASLMELPGPDSSYALPIISDGSSPLAAVPEPGSWAMLILGFGLIGGTLRWRRAKTAVAHGL